MASALKQMLLIQTEDFVKRKAASLAVIDDPSSLDKSPKGGVDAPIATLIRDINAHPDFATTSSCSGRCSLYEAQTDTSRMKGSGNFLVAAHHLIKPDGSELTAAIEASLASGAALGTTSALKHEPFVLHVMCRTLSAAQAMLQVAIEVGFRESGIRLGSKIMLGVRTTSNVLEAPIARDGKLVVTNEYLLLLVEQLNERFRDNERRVAAFHNTLLARGLAGATSGSVALTAFADAGAGDEDRFVESNASSARNLDSRPIQLEKEVAWNPLLDPTRNHTLSRWSHTMSNLTHDSLLIFGGWGQDESSALGNHARLSAGVVYRPFANKLEPASSATGETPCARVNHSSTSIPSSEAVVIFGGRTSPIEALSDVWTYSLADAWTKRAVGEDSIAARWSHAAPPMSSTGIVWIHGGRNSTEALSDLWSWNSLTGAMQKHEPSGESPGPRFNHVLFEISAHELCVHGGIDSLIGGRCVSSPRVYDVRTNAWSTPVGWDSSSVIPKRFSHRAVCLKDRVLILGGVRDDWSADEGSGRAIDLRTKEWSALRTDDRYGDKNSMSACLVRHAVCGVSPARGSEPHGIISVGGGATCFAFGSVFSSSFSTGLENLVIDPPTPAPNSGARPAAVPIDAAQPPSSSSWFVVVRKEIAETCRKKLLEAKALDKSRKVIFRNDGSEPTASFPIFDAARGSLPTLLSEFAFELVEERRQAEDASVSPEETRRKKKELQDRISRSEKIDDVLLLPKSDTEDLSEETCLALLSAASCSAIARAADVDAGTTRASRVRIVYPPSRSGPARGPLPLDEDESRWVRVKENGVQYRFDLTKCMFSRGNIHEKQRFASLCREDEVVVDLFAGIGYFTLPALVKSKCRIVHAVEWNPDALRALRLNLAVNGVENRCVVHPGDCRLALDVFGVGADRVSLGLIPTATVGYLPALKCLNPVRGGWLHVHGNAADDPESIRAWAHAEAAVLEAMARGMSPERTGWSVSVAHVQRVKSYAPRVAHLVADLRVGPPEPQPASLGSFTPQVQESVYGRVKTEEHFETLAEHLVTRANDVLLCARGGLHATAHARQTAHRLAHSIAAAAETLERRDQQAETP